MKEAEKAVLADKVSTLQAELAAVTLEAERMSREAAHCKEQEQVDVPLLFSYLSVSQPWSLDRTLDLRGCRYLMEHFLF